MALGVPFGNYRLVRRIARGGMAEVFLAWQLSPSTLSLPVAAAAGDRSGDEGFYDHTTGIRFVRQVAVKRILPHLSRSDEFRALFLQEARLAATLSHPNVAHIYDYGRTAECLYLAMELIDGVDLLALSQRRGAPPDATLPAAPVRIPIEHALRVAADVLAGLHHAHTRADSTGRPLHIVHRDISPQNLMITLDGVVKVLDFGIAKAAWSVEGTRPGATRGKYPYMSPEQVEGLRLDPRSDVYAVGVCLFELLTGTALIPRELPMEAALRLVRGGGALDGLAQLELLRSDVPWEVHAILRRALQPRREQRYESAAEMQLDVERFLKGWPHLSSSVLLAQYLHDLRPSSERIGAGPGGVIPADDWAGEATPVVGPAVSGPAVLERPPSVSAVEELEDLEDLPTRRGMEAPPISAEISLPGETLPRGMQMSSAQLGARAGPMPGLRGDPTLTQAEPYTRLIPLPRHRAEAPKVAGVAEKTAFVPITPPSRRPAAILAVLRSPLALAYLFPAVAFLLLMLALLSRC